MDEHTATEQAFMNGEKVGYKRGYEDGTRDAVVHGHWIRKNSPWRQGGHILVCSHCEEQIESLSGNLKYCPGCGARMDANGG